MLLTNEVFTRPWCVLEVCEAIQHNIPIVPLAVKNKGLSEYNFEQNAQFLMAWDLEIEARNPGALKVVVEYGMDPTTVAFLLSGVATLIAQEFNPHASDNVLAATIADIVDRKRFPS